jgi:nucleotide-binding universal stress UspA family protein
MRQGPALICAGTSPEVARTLARHAAALLAARKAVVLSVWDAGDPDELQVEERQAAEAAAQAAAEELEGAGWDVARRVEAGPESAAQVALQIAEELDAAVTVAGAHERPDAEPGSLGHEVRALAHASAGPLLVVPRDAPPSGDGPLFAAYDGSGAARAALEAAGVLLQPRRVIVATAARSVDGTSSARRAFDEESRARAAQTAAEGATRLPGAEAAELLSPAPPWAALARAADAAGAAVIVAGNKGHSRIAALLLGSVAEGLLRHAGRPVLLVAETS